MPVLTQSGSDQAVAAVRRFNRFYTKQIGVLGDQHLDSPFSLTEVRVLYELDHREEITATDLSRELGLDAGYLSRILRGFEKNQLIVRRSSETDARQSIVSLSDKGRQAFAALNERASEAIERLLKVLSAGEQSQLIEAMTKIESLLGDERDRKVPYILRTHQPGDMGWVVHRHGALYAREYGYDERFEALVAEIVAKFIHDFDSARERCWVADRDGEILGSVFLVKHSDKVAQLRLFLVEPSARGLGIGSRLLNECIRFARQAGYSKITLWTNDVQVDARRLYERAGFQLVKEETHEKFGPSLVGQTFELKL
jgi:DNA-binding MarR family transcriptional regulator/GNAT superfamily N-acetyltransferase